MSKEYRSVFSTKRFWIISGVPIVGAIAASLWVSSQLSLGQCLPTDCLQGLYEHFKIPLWIAALSLPLAGLITSNHRAAQQAESMRLQESALKHSQLQFNLNNHYARLNDFTEYLVEHSDEAHKSTIRCLYKSLYPNSQSGDISIDSRVVVKLEDSLSCVSRYLESNPSSSSKYTSLLALSFLYHYAIQYSYFSSYNSNADSWSQVKAMWTMYRSLFTAVQHHNPYNTVSGGETLSILDSHLRRHWEDDLFIFDEIYVVNDDGRRGFQEIDFKKVRELESSLSKIWYDKHSDKCIDFLESTTEREFLSHQLV